MNKRVLSRVLILSLSTLGLLIAVGNGCGGGFTTEDFSSLSAPMGHFDNSGGSTLPPPLPVPEDPSKLPFAPAKQPELRPLTPREYDRSVQMMLGINQELGKSNLPEFPAEPFDNEAEANQFGKAHIESFEYTAGKVAEAFLASSSKSNFIPCSPSGANDRNCLEKFTVQMTSLAFRKMTTAAEVKDIVDLALADSTSRSKFDEGLRTVITVVLQDPQFLYRMEVGKAKGSDFELTPMEYLSKMTYFILGSPPTMQQIQAVANGALDSESSREQFVTNLLNDSKVVDQMDLFHAQWFGYSALGGQSDQAAQFRTETKALIQKVINQNLPWKAVLTSDETYANGNLSKIYDTDDQATTGWKWRKYKGDKRQGLLSHGSFLSVGVKFGDTSTTRRGYNLQKALFCGAIGRPPTVDENGNPIDIDEPPASDQTYECKEDLYRNTVLSKSNCAVCHGMMDTIAFGLENFGTDGSYRTTEPNKPACVIRGQGEVTVLNQGKIVKLGTFSGPKQLADLALESGYVENCMATRLIQFSIGRKLNSTDANLIQKVNAFNRVAPNFKSFLKTYLLSPEFRVRKGS